VKKTKKLLMMQKILRVEDRCVSLALRRAQMYSLSNYSDRIQVCKGFQKGYGRSKEVTSVKVEIVVEVEV